jgi:magnesium chelatase subunit D
MSGSAPPASPYPFSAVVGADEVKLALLLNAVDPRVGGVLLRGDKGSAKSTLVRGLAALLPGGAPFVELPVGATEDRLVGTIDVGAVLTTGTRRFQPGLLAAAHGGVLYVDEVNLLPDHLVDVLLDVAASGTNRVEREGISEAHPARFVLAGSMNPEEGELRPQLLDRFGLAVDVTASLDPDVRAEAVRRRLAHDADPAAFADAWSAAEGALATRLAAARPATLDDDLVRTVSTVCASVGAEGLRADLAVCRAAAALAGWEGRPEATPDDVRRVAHLALAHRRRRGPFDDPGVDRDAVDEAVARATGAKKAGPPADPPGCSPTGDGTSTEEPDPALQAADSDGGPPAGQHPGGDATSAPHDPARDALPSGRGGAPPGRNSGSPAAAGAPPGSYGGSPAADQPAAGDMAPQDRAPVAPGTPTTVPALRAPRAELPDHGAGRRSPAIGHRGRLVGDRVPDGPAASVAVGATARAAAVRRAGRIEGPLVDAADLREPVREQLVGNLVVLAVDASASMGVEHRMQAVKGAAMSLLLDAYQRRDRVSLVVFRGFSADVLLRPTGSVEVARARLAELPTGGRTPLAAGIHQAIAVATGHRGGHRPLLVLVSDGRATAGPGDADPMAAAFDAAAEVRRRALPAVVVDVETGPTRLGLAAELAEAMGARHLTLPEVSTGALTAAVRQAVAP